ncbi:MAG: RpiB/LacA/LacB family sugar-phosphate isomerase [Bdellovibrionales bacterium]|nr:RpiB/LacA/LacB family sugar-phosphate isomerase [Bdellovibrionales bacterium]
MKLFIASDHAGFELKGELIKSRPDVEWIDLGPSSADSVDYPDYAQKLTTRMLQECRGDALLKPCAVLICGSGVGMSIAANRTHGVRAVLALREDVAVLSRQHNASNVLCLGSRLVSQTEASKILSAWLGASFEGGRHERRVAKMDQGGQE